MRIYFGVDLTGKGVSWGNWLFILLVLFVPTNSFYIYYGSLFVGLLFLAWGSRGVFLWRKEVVALLLGSMFFLLLTSFFRVSYFSNTEDFKEVIKIIAFFVVLLFGVQLRRKDLEFIFSIFVVLNFCFSLSQYLGLYSFGVRELTELYNAKHHVDVSLSYASPRAIGLSAGPGQQSVIGLFFFSYFLVLYFFGGGGYRRLFLCLIALFGILLSQSKTALISMAFGSLIVSILFIVHGRSRERFLILFVMSLFSCGALLLYDEAIRFFPEYARLFEQGQNVSSLQSRYGNWAKMLEVFSVENSLLFYFFGIGRSGLESYGVNDLPYDSDYVYILVNYGLFGVVLFSLFLGWFLVRAFIFFSRESIYGKILTVVLVYAVFSAVALNYFFEPRILILLAVVVFNYFVSSKSELI